MNPHPELPRTPELSQTGPTQEHLRQARYHLDLAHGLLRRSTPEYRAAAAHVATSYQRALSAITTWHSDPVPEGADVRELGRRAINFSNVLRTPLRQALAVLPTLRAVGAKERLGVHDREGVETAWYTARNLYRTVTSSVEEVEARRQAIISANAAVEATQTGYEVGTRNVVDVLEAQRNLYRSVRDYNDVRYNYIINNLNLKLAAGTLSPQDLRELSRWLNPDYDPARDFIPPFSAEETERMSMGGQAPETSPQQRMRRSF